MDNEVSQWLEGVAQGEQTAIQKVWDCCHEQLMRLARRKLGEGSRRMADEEDVALSAFHSFCQGAAAGKFPELGDRHDLWRILVTITARKAAAQLRRGRRQKRGGGTVRGESVFLRRDDLELDRGVQEVAANAPTPEVAAMMSDQCEHLLDQLHDDLLRQVALARLEGYSNEEIAVLMGCAPRTVERKLARIRELWGAEGPG